MKSNRGGISFKITKWRNDNIKHSDCKHMDSEQVPGAAKAGRT